MGPEIYIFLSFCEIIIKIVFLMLSPYLPKIALKIVLSVSAMVHIKEAKVLKISMALDRVRTE